MLKALSVSELSQYISGMFESDESLHYIRVYGEVSDAKLSRGNMFFTLKDADALLSCIIFNYDGDNIKDGKQVLLTGGLRYYTKAGRVNLYVTGVMPYGEGLLYQKFIELKNKLEKEGVFSSKYKKPLPKHIKRVGVITSKTGAVLHDIVKVSHRRNPLIDIIVYPCKVQGVGAEQTIIRGLRYFSKRDDIDVVIIARGGGSIEDLQPFNTESLAREIILNPHPVVSAVGHETDFTICDFASSVRCATPSEAGELVSVDIFAGMDKLKDSIDKIYYLTSHLVGDKFSTIDRTTGNIDRLSVNKMLVAESKLVIGINKLVNIKAIDKILGTFDLTYNKLININPQKILERGYIRVNKKETGLVSSVNDVLVGDNLILEFMDGKVSSIAKKVIRREDK